MAEDDKDEIDKLRRLSPRERIQKLKEIQKKNKQEIEKAQKLLSEAEDEAKVEAKVEEEIEDMPIPQLTAVDIEGLFSPEERELFRAKRFVSKAGEYKVSESREQEKAKKKSSRGSDDLEDIAAASKGLSLDHEQEHVQYIDQMRQQPAEHLYSRAKELYSDFREKGYLNPREQEEFNAIEYANRKKMEDIEQGRYTQIDQKVANDMILIEKMKNSLYKK